MFRTFARKFFPNPLDQMLKKTAKKGGKKILLGWNRGLGDIALGLYAIVHRIRKWIPDAEITFITRKNLIDGFSMLEGVSVLCEPSWERGADALIPSELKKKYDLVIEKPSPTDWVRWQRASLVPKLKWNEEFDSFFKKFQLDEATYIGVQLEAETSYGLWRNWPLSHWEELFGYFEQLGIYVLLFGYGRKGKSFRKNVVDLRGKTTLFELLSIIKNKVSALILPDSGISSMVYYLNSSFSICHITLWADPNHGILKQNVASPNQKLEHIPLIAKEKNLASILPLRVLEKALPLEKAGAILLAGGMGMRLNMRGPKGLFKIKGKTLFEWKLEKIDPRFPVAIMTSSLNHLETISFFKRHNCFGRRIFFFEQEMLSYLDENKKEVEEKAPDGNGSVFKAFQNGELRERFEKMGIESIVISNIENPLSHPLNPALVYLTKSNDIAVQCIKKEELDHPMGIVLEEKGKVKIVEYTDLDPNKEYHFAYSGQMAFRFSFFLKLGEKKMPIHWRLKKVGNRWLYKGEKYLFDALEDAETIKTFCASKKSCYAPVKSKESVPLVEKMLE